MIDDDGVVGALAREAGSAATHEKGEVLGAAVVDDADEGVDGVGHNDADGFDLVDGGVGGVEHAIVAGESDAAGGHLLQIGGNAGAIGIGKSLRVRGV
jgi:hypothetical protein